MKAIVNTIYGPPEVLKFSEVEKPVPADSDVLIKVYSTTVNRTDSGFRDPQYFLVRLVGGLFKPKNQILGSEFSGIVEEVGKNVKSFKVGEKVFGLSTYKFGTHAEYLSIAEEKSFTRMPSNMSFDEAAAVCDGAFLAYAMLKGRKINKGSKVLVNGASGSIGVAAVQLAIHFGAEVTAVGNPRSLEILASLGAKTIIDFTREDFTRRTEKYDLILDCVGKSSFFKCRKIMNPGAIYISSELGFAWQNVFLALLSPLSPGKKVLFPVPKDKKEDIIFFRELIEAGEYKAVIDKFYPLEQIVEATRYVETGEKTGNVVIKVVL